MAPDNRMEQRLKGIVGSMDLTDLKVFDTAPLRQFFGQSSRIFGGNHKDVFLVNPEDLGRSILQQHLGQLMGGGTTDQDFAGYSRQ